MFIIFSNRSLENEDQDIEDDKYSTTSLIWKDLYPQVCLPFILN